MAVFNINAYQAINLLGITSFRRIMFLSMISSEVFNHLFNKGEILEVKKNDQIP
jgi:hypothetical protein